MPNNLTDQSSQAPRVFQAINGAELKQIILDEVRRTLDADSRFQPHLTFPQFSFAFALKLNRYPGEPPTLEVKSSYKRVAPGDVQLGDEEVLDVLGVLNVDAPAEGGLAPDEARERAHLPVPTPTRIPVGKAGMQVVDQASTPAAPAAATAAATDEPLDVADLVGGHPSPKAAARLAASRNPAPVPPRPPEPKNRPDASPRVARSVNLATRVHPDGVSVDDGDHTGLTSYAQGSGKHRMGNEETE